MIAGPDLEKLVFFDLETTGLEVDCRIVQIAMIRGEKLIQHLVNPEMPIPPESTEIHRIRDEDVADAPTIHDLADEILAFLQDSVLAGFNIRKFDIPVLKRELARAGRELPFYPVLDLFELNQKMNPRTLAWFFQHYTGEAMDKEEAHDAVYDCACTRKGFLSMYQKHPELPTNLAELTAFAEPDRLNVANSSWFVWTATQCEPAFSRGKYRNWALSDVQRKEPSYLEWLAGIDADPATKNLLFLYKTNKDAYVELLRQEHPSRLEPRYLWFRNAMDRKELDKYPELVALARSSNDPSLVFLAAAWGQLQHQPEAAQMAELYLTLKDVNANLSKRQSFIQKNFKL